LDNDKSIFDMISQRKEEQPGLPYRFQDGHTAGRKDVLSVLLSEGIPFWQKEDLARECCVILKELVHNEGDILDDAVLHHFLERHPLCTFFIEFRERMRISMETEPFSKERLYQVGMRLARDSKRLEEVKLGIMILGFFPYDTSRQVLRILGYHSDFTMFVLESVQYVFPQQNQFIFELAKHTVGYGKLAALFLLKPVTKEQQQWMLHLGIKSDFLSNIYANLCMQKADMRIHLKRAEIIASNYSDFSYLTCYADYTHDSLSIDAHMDLNERMVDKREYANAFIDLAALVSIWYQTVDYWQQDYDYISQNEKQYKETKTMWDIRFARYEKLVHKVETFLHQPKWRHVVYQELAEPKEMDNLIVKVILFLNMRPDFSAFIDMMTRQPLGFNLMDFFLKVYPEVYFDEVCEYLDAILNPELFVLPLEAETPEDADITDLYRADMWLEKLFEVMREKRKYKEEWCVRGIHYRNPDVRHAALLVLQQNKQKWSQEVIKELEQAATVEPNERNKKKVAKILHPEDVPEEKERRYLQPAEKPFHYSGTDKELLRTHIAGIQFCDLSVVADHLKRGDVLQLIREEDNPYDKNAIIVATQSGYVLGYVPKIDNRILAKLMDAEERLFAVLKAETIEEAKPAIIISLRRTLYKALPQEQSQGIILPFPPPKKKQSD